MISSHLAVQGFKREVGCLQSVYRYHIVNRVVKLKFGEWNCGMMWLDNGCKGVVEVWRR